MPILKPLTTNEFIVRDSFHFAEEIVDQQLDFFMGSLDVDSLFINIPLEEIIEICANDLLKESETLEGLSKSEFKELLSLANKDLHSVFDATRYEQIDGAAMDSPLSPTLANAFLVYHGKNWLQRCPLEYRPFYYQGMLIYLLFFYQNI